MVSQRSTVRVSRRQFLLASAGIVSVAALAACTAPGAAPAAAGGGAAAPSGAPVEISFMGWGGTEEDQGVRAAVEVFEKEEPGIKVTWIQTPDNYATKFLAQIAAGTPPDTCFTGSADYYTYIHNGILLDITDHLQNDPLLGAKDYFIEPQETNRCTKDGKWYGIGSCWVAPHIYYNADIFEKEGIEPPSNNPDKAWTWDKFVETAKQLTVDTAGKHPGEAGFDADNIDRYGAQWPTILIPLHSLIASNDGYWIDPNTGLLALDKPEATEAIQAIADLVLVDQVAPRSTAMESLGMTNSQMLDNGKLAMAIDGSWALAWMHKIKPKLETAVLPGLKHTATDMQAHIHTALKASPHPEESWRWVRFLSTPFYQTQFCKIGLWLPSQSALMTADGLKTWITEGVHPEGYDQIATQFVPRFGQILYQPVGWAEADAIVTPALDGVWTGEKTAEAAMTDAVPQANEILQKYQS